MNFVSSFRRAATTMMLGLVSAILYTQLSHAQACEAHGADETSAAAFFEDIFSLTDGDIYGWQQPVRLGLYGFGPLVFSPEMQVHVRSLREVTGLDIGLRPAGEGVNAALVYVNFRAVRLDPNLQTLVTAFAGSGSDLFSPTGALARDEDGYHYHFRLRDEGRPSIALGAVFVDKQRFSLAQAEALAVKAVNDLLLVGGPSSALSPSLRQSPETVLTYLEACPRLPRADLNLLNQVYEPRVISSVTALQLEAMDAQPLSLFPDE